MKKFILLFMLITSPVFASNNVMDKTTITPVPADDYLYIIDAGTSDGKATITSVMNASESVLEAIIDLQDLQGAVTDAQVPDNITITDNATQTWVASQSYLTEETDPKISTLINTKWCTTNGSVITCNVDPVTDTNTTYSASGTLLQLIGTAFSVDEGTLTNGKGCKFVSGTGLVCDQDYLTSVASDSTWTGHNSYPAACSAGQYVSAIGDTLTCSAPTDNNTTYTASGSLLQLSGTAFSLKEGTLTNGKFCTYSTTSGLVCNSDANNYSLPTATDSVLGGVKVGSGLSITEGVLSATGGGYTNLTSFEDQTAWRLFYSDADGDVTELALGSDGEYLKSNGASVAPSWGTPTGGAHDAVTLAGQDYLSLATQQITANLINGDNINWSTIENISENNINWLDFPTYTDDYYLRATGTGVAFEAVAGGAGGNFFWVLEPQQAKLPAVNPMAIDAGNARWRGLFDDTTAESATWEGVLQPFPSGTLKAKLFYSMASGTAGKVEFLLSIDCYSADDAVDFDTASFGTADSLTETVPGTAGYVSVIADDSLNGDSCAEGDLIVVQISRDATDETNDDATGDAELRKVIIYAK